eukprot:CAMPEP_0119336790 /NCGR_PEP_ID=MMETSP1333-20130426/92581_1 /TAXON_ID=418940 /ORGANISM="Scyphosphaera apsteinii, Strain RCC1455" /LENGTH=124 /DNA_ID=CAMNT_0007347657 /DNA_START=176 /DNA_END=550 /DNA_ORIENTATION=-
MKVDSEKPVGKRIGGRIDDRTENHAKQQSPLQIAAEVLRNAGRSALRALRAPARGSLLVALLVALLVSLSTFHGGSDTLYYSYSSYESTTFSGYDKDGQPKIETKRSESFKTNLPSKAFVEGRL